MGSACFWRWRKGAGGIGGSPPSFGWYDNNPGATSFSISTPEHFAGLVQLVFLNNAAASGDSFSGKTVNLTANIDLGKSNTQVGGGGQNSPFAGTFDGKEHTISLDMNVSSIDHGSVGLFGTNKGTVMNLTVSGTIVGEKQETGGVVAHNDGGKVENCTSNVNVKNTLRQSLPSVGGVVGRNFNSGIVKGCTNAGTVLSVTGNVGGVVGRNGYEYGNGGRGTVEDCTNTGAVSFEVGEYLGGVVGFNDGGSIKNSTNSGAVSATSNEAAGGIGGVGGIVGRSRENSTIENCTNTGTVTMAGEIYGNAIAGGIVGRNESGSLVKGSTNNEGIISVTVTTSGNKYIGGVAGWNDGGTVATCKWIPGTGGDATYGIGKPAGNIGVEVVIPIKASNLHFLRCEN